MLVRIAASRHRPANRSLSDPPCDELSLIGSTVRNSFPANALRLFSG